MRGLLGGRARTILMAPVPARWRRQGGELLVELGVVGALELDEQGGVGVLGQHGVDPGVVLAHQGEEAGVHDLDGGGLERQDARARPPRTAKTDGK